MPRASDAPQRIVGGFEGRADEFGFVAPPVALRLKLLKTPHHWSAFVQPFVETPLEKLIEWLPRGGILRVEFGSRHVLRADYQPLPEAWARTFEGVSLDLARLDPGGEAAVSVSGSRRAVAAFARRLFGPQAPLDLVKLRKADAPASFLTLPQDGALRAAVAAGYYRIPRALNLNELAAKLGVSSASLSERLRRAEGRVITRYVDEGSASPWDARTIFDLQVSDEADVEWPEPAPQPSPTRGVDP